MDDDTDSSRDDRGDSGNSNNNGNGNNNGKGNGNNNGNGNGNNASGNTDDTPGQTEENDASTGNGNSGNANTNGNGNSGSTGTSSSRDAAAGTDALNLAAGWGAWSIPGVASVQVNSSVAITEFSVNQPADMDAMRSTSGRWSFASVGQFSGSGTAGSLTGLSMGFDVNLNSGNISNGSFNATVGGSENWATSFSGTVSGATASMGGFSNGINGTMVGGFTVNNGFVTGFALTNGSGSALGGLGVLPGTPQ